MKRTTKRTLTQLAVSVSGTGALVVILDLLSWKLNCGLMGKIIAIAFASGIGAFAGTKFVRNADP